MSFLWQCLVQDCSVGVEILASRYVEILGKSLSIAFYSFGKGVGLADFAMSHDIERAREYCLRFSR